MREAHGCSFWRWGNGADRRKLGRTGVKQSVELPIGGRCRDDKPPILLNGSCDIETQDPNDAELMIGLKGHPCIDRLAFGSERLFARVE